MLKTWNLRLEIQEERRLGEKALNRQIWKHVTFEVQRVQGKVNKERDSRPSRLKKH